jgi:hypothetical protein
MIPTIKDIISEQDYYRLKEVHMAKKKAKAKKKKTKKKTKKKKRK